jgi:hypothetical protein
VRFVVPLALVACGPKLDPLLPMKAELGEARRMPPGDAPHVRLTLAAPTAAGLVKRALQSDEPLTVPVMLGTSARISPDLGEPRLEITASPACDCPRANLFVEGTVDVELAGLLGRAVLADDLAFTATATGTARLGIQPGEDGGQVVVLEPEPRDPWAVDIRLAQPAGLINDATINRQVTAPIAELLSRPVPLFAMPPAIPVRLSRIGLDTRPDPSAGLWLIAAPAGPVDELSVDEGWAVGTTDANLLAGARAAFAELPQTRNWRAEPTDLAVDDGELTFGLRLHKVARSPRWRAYSVRATYTIDEAITVRPVEVVRTGRRGFTMSVVGPFVDARVRKQLLATVVEQPASLVRKVGASEVTFTLRSIQADGDGVIARGSVDYTGPTAGPAE